MVSVIKNNASYVLKLFINHFVSGIYSLVLYIVLSVAFEGKYIIAGSILSILFYLYLIYSFMWEAGAKRAVGFNDRAVRITDGAVIISVASSVFYLSTVMAFVLSFFTTNAEFAEKAVDVLYNTLFYINVFFTQSMYSGLLSGIFGGIPNVAPLWYLISLFPGLITASVAYYMGSKSFRIRKIFGISYDEEKEKIKNNY